MSLSRSDLLAWGYIFLLVLAVAIGMVSATPFPTDDHFFFQEFIEKLAGGTLDLSISGFHGMNIVAVPWYWITRSPIAQIEFQMFSGMLIPLFAFLAGRALFRSTWHGIIFATIMAMMPFLSFSSLRGWMVATYHCLILLTLFLAAIRSRWTWLPFGFSLISLPFAAALLPLLIVLTADNTKPLYRRYDQVILGLSIPVVYLLMQFLQAGKIHVGVHEEFDAVGVWQGPAGMIRNAAHALQMLFSVHNFYFPNPAKTAQGNLMHTTPILIFLGLFSLLSPKDYFNPTSSASGGLRGARGLSLALLLGFLIGIGLNVAIDHMDHFYMETGILFLILASLPVLRKHPLWIPIVLATLHFQWFYFYLQFKDVFLLGKSFFLVPLFVDAAFILWLSLHLKEAVNICKNIVLPRA
ncbi:MAG: hypothetical protein AAB489_04730 [Patescibacteria group bacterium]